MSPILNSLHNEEVCILPNEVRIRELMVQISEVQEDAFYICDLGQVLRKFQEWKTQMPRVKPFYAVKCNPHPAFLETLASLGAAFDCASIVEMEKVLNLGVTPEKIIFAHPTKLPSHIRFAKSKGIKMMTFDNESELHKIQAIYPDSELVLRICYDSSTAPCLFGRKFGVDPACAPVLLRIAKKLNLNVIGVSFHIGSGGQETSVFANAISTCKWIFNEAESCGFQLRMMDIGGGFPVGPGFSKFADVINRALNEHFPLESGVEVIAEPGRFFAGSAFSLATRIHSIQTPSTISANYKYFINDGVYGSFSCRLVEPQVNIPVQPLVTKSEPPAVFCSIWGQTCDAYDVVMEDVKLPVMHVGDWLFFPNMGAYSFTVAAGFNGFPTTFQIYNVLHSDSWKSFKNLSESLNCLNRKSLLVPVNSEKVETFNRRRQSKSSLQDFIFGKF